MFAIVQNNKVVQMINGLFTLNNVEYPSNWLQLASDADKAELGIMEVVYESRPDDRYYWVTESAPIVKDNQVVVGFTATEKDLVSMQESATAQLKSMSYSVLLPSDWMVVKATETGVAMDAKWKTWRASVRAVVLTAVTAIAAAKTVDEVAAAVTACQFPLDPASADLLAKQNSLAQTK
jgi:hypothetical protein